MAENSAFARLRGAADTLSAEGVGELASTEAVKGVGRGLASDGVLCEFLVLGEGLVVVVEVLVDDGGHAGLAVVAGGLGAVVPDGVLVFDLEGEDVLVLAGAGGSGVVEAGKDAAGERLAGLLEGGLGDGVVLGGWVSVCHCGY